jgi:hydroxymethylglutaryl-CoA reductase
MTNMERSSQISGFYKLSIEERLKNVKEFAGLTDDEASILRLTGGLRFETADRMIENVVGTMPIPLGIATNFLINGREYLIPMAIEEPSVVAAASNAAKIARQAGGFRTSTTGSVMVGQIQVVGLAAANAARLDLLAQKDRILKKANDQDPILVSLGGGARDLRAKVIETHRGQMLIAELLVDCKDAMGANAVNTMAEAVAPLVEEVTGGRVLLRIISNLATERLMRAIAVFPKDALGGADVVEAILDAYAFAASDTYRASTHNKGIMNGVTAVVLATGNDTRAVEAGAHTYASRSGRYVPLTCWEKGRDGDLIGTLEMPLAVGLVGGATATHPVAKISVKILGAKSANELGEVICAVGLAQNLAALRALATEGIQRGHMSLHARNVAIAAGAKGELIDRVAAKMVEERKVRSDRAKELLAQMKGN